MDRKTDRKLVGQLSGLVGWMDGCLLFCTNTEHDASMDVLMDG